MIRNARDRSAEQKLAIEGLLGRAISDRENIGIGAFEPAGEVPQVRREEILAGLKAHFARVDAERQPVSPEEADEIINEALRSTRPNYQSVR
jgi:hypothetical protein